MKLLSVTVPYHNSEYYVEHCIQTPLTSGDEVGIVIMDDRSAEDRTTGIADEYVQGYSNIRHTVHRGSGGHGEVVNTGFKNTKGIFFKVVDSGDQINGEAF